MTNIIWLKKDFSNVMQKNGYPFSPLFTKPGDIISRVDHTEVLVADRLPVFDNTNCTTGGCCFIVPGRKKRICPG
ncbi:hypothetical protein ED312_11615 [Sinomicrobium pectinilyticum]|uniref:Uncharacterized protein n=1 Tax=Sinomicrobium pectinilyticum TaxID=1084421 RepID=A0A3N0EEI3_SINP1|nr:hypothetical protein ED312_11615 [Sinomicrobium pectinilyticum]